MAKIRIHAGDFLPNRDGQLTFGSLVLPTAEKAFAGEAISITKLESVEVATEESVKRLGGTVGWGVAGAVVLGPVGLLAGLLLGGKGKDVTFAATFKDGRRLLATTDSKTFTKLKAQVF